jgi:hypothetical protein
VFPRLRLWCYLCCSLCIRFGLCGGAVSTARALLGCLQRPPQRRTRSLLFHLVWSVLRLSLPFCTAFAFSFVARCGRRCCTGPRRARFGGCARRALAAPCRARLLALVDVQALRLEPLPCLAERLVVRPHALRVGVVRCELAQANDRVELLVRQREDLGGLEAVVDGRDGAVAEARLKTAEVVLVVEAIVLLKQPRDLRAFATR